jgi:hypothetical protein
VQGLLHLQHTPGGPPRAHPGRGVPCASRSLRGRPSAHPAHRPTRGHPWPRPLRGRGPERPAMLGGPQGAPGRQTRHPWLVARGCRLLGFECWVRATPEALTTPCENDQPWMAGWSTGVPERRRASQGGTGPCPRQGVGSRDGPGFAQARDAPSSANPGTTEKHREPRARKARGGATGCAWRCRRPCHKTRSPARAAAAVRNALSLATTTRPSKQDCNHTNDVQRSRAGLAPTAMTTPRQQEAGRAAAADRNRCVACDNNKTSHARQQPQERNAAVASGDRSCKGGTAVARAARSHDTPRRGRAHGALPQGARRLETRRDPRAPAPRRPRPRGPQGAL